MDLSALSDEDLIALKGGDLSKVSDEGLMALRGGQKPESGIVSGARDLVSGLNRTWAGVGDQLVNAYNLMLPKSQEVRPLSEGMSSVGIELDRPRSLPGMIGEYAAMPFGPSVGKGLLSAGVAAVGGYAGRQAAPDSALAEMAGAMSPSFAWGLTRELPRQAIVGGQARRAAMKQNAAAFTEATGTTPSPAQAGGTVLAQFAEKGFAPTPGGAAAVHARGLEQQQKFAETVQRNLNVPGSSRSIIGAAFRDGDLEHLGRFRSESRLIWDRVTNLFNGKSLPKTLPTAFKVDSTRAAYDDIINSVPEQDIIQAGLDSKIKKIGKFLETYQGGMSVGGMRRMKDLAADLLEPGLDYKPRQAGLADKLYRSMIDDMGGAAKVLDAEMLKAGIKPKPGMSATELLDNAVEFHKAEMKRRALLPKNIKEMPDYDLGSWLTNETDINALKVAKENVGPERWAKIRGTKIGEMLQAPSSKQTNELKTSSESLLSKWTDIEKKDPRLLDVWFGTGAYRQDVNKVIKAASDMRLGSQMLINPSGSGAAGITGATLGAATMAAMSGNVPLAGLIIGYMSATYGGMRVWLNSPKLVNWLAGTVNDPPSALAGRVARLATIQINDPEERKARDEMVAALKAAQQNQ